MSVAFRSSKRRRRLMEAMVLLRDWPLVLVICFANFLTNIIAWGPMPPVVEKHIVHASISAEHGQDALYFNESHTITQAP